MADPFPEVNFDWLANLPDVYQAAQIQAGRKATLANLNSADPASLDKAIAGLLAAGDTETAIKLYNARSTRITANQRMADAAIWADYLRKNPGAITGGALPGRLPDVSTPPGANYQLPSPDETGAGGGGPFGPPPAVTPGGTTTVPPGLLPPPPGPQTGLPTPPPSMAGVQLAGPVPTPDTGPGPGPGSVPPGLLPSTVQGAQIPAPPPMQAPLAPPQQPTSQGPNQFEQSMAAAEAERDAAAKALIQMPPRAPAAAVSAASKRLQAAMERLKWPSDTIAYQLDNAQRIREGLPAMTYQDWKTNPSLATERYKAVNEAFSGTGTRGGPGGYRTEAMKANNLLDTVDRMEAIVNHPKFVSGEGTELIQHAVSRFSALTGIARSIGVPESFINSLQSINGLKGAALSTVLAENFTALSNQAIYQTLGSLGNQISEGDRNFMVKAFPSLSLTPAGNRVLLGIMKQTAQKAAQAGKYAEEYMRSKPDPQLSVAGMDMYVRRKVEENSAFASKVDATGNPILNKAGKEMQDKVDEALRMSGFSGTSTVPSAPAPPPAAPAQKYFGPNPKGSGPDIEYLRLPDGRWVPKSSMQGT